MPLSSPMQISGASEIPGGLKKLFRPLLYFAKVCTYVKQNLLPFLSNNKNKNNSSSSSVKLPWWCSNCVFHALSRVFLILLLLFFFQNADSPQYVTDRLRQFSDPLARFQPIGGEYGIPILRFYLASAVVIIATAPTVYVYIYYYTTTTAMRAACSSGLAADHPALLALSLIPC